MCPVKLCVMFALLAIVTAIAAAMPSCHRAPAEAHTQLAVVLFMSVTTVR